ncbi:unnamed protein product [Pleuronectes platessa]|uniref:Uncharacterized protein n=1 Tax=Pleuronectes platessa TaxID=8262 RepID=A0A9N7UTE4_PLEPL|nr:unnamed protein product [Pleuronectes platessa]
MIHDVAAAAILDLPAIKHKGCGEEVNKRELSAARCHSGCNCGGMTLRMEIRQPLQIIRHRTSVSNCSSCPMKPRLGEMT